MHIKTFYIRSLSTVIFNGLPSRQDVLSSLEIILKKHNHQSLLNVMGTGGRNSENVEIDHL